MNRNIVSYLSLDVVFIIAATLNYNALQHFACDKAQVNSWLSFGVPILILIDTFIAMVSVALINREQGERTGLAKTALADGETCTVDWLSREANWLRLDGMLAAGVNFSHAAKVLKAAPNTVCNWAKHLNGNSLSEGKVQQ